MNRYFASTGFRSAALLALAVVASAGDAEAHAFLSKASPAVGSTVATAPTDVAIWYTEAVEPAFSKIQVLDASGKQVDKGNTHVDPKDGALLHVSVTALQPGTYKVVWQVVSVDTHHTNGDFSFTLQ